MAEETTEAPKKKSKIGMMIPVLVLVLGLGGAGFFFMGGKKDAGAAAPTTTTTAPGPIIRLEPITMNLTDGHVLKVGLALELLAKPKEKELQTVVAAAHGGGGGHGGGGDTSGSPMLGLESKALDIAIHHLGNKSFTELSAVDGKAHAKDELQKEIEHAYHGDVVNVYFTTFVMS